MKVGSLAAGLLVLSSCLEPTQVTFNITTDVQCENISATAITVGLEGETERAAPVKVVKNCNNDGVVSAIGTYAIKPGATKNATASFKVTLGVGSEVDVEAQCTASKGYRGCIVARRRVVFVPHRALEIPVRLLAGCLNVQCDQNSSCVGSGRCATSEIDTDKCGKENVCTAVLTKPDEGLPCYNDQTPPLFCGGQTSWCTRDDQSQRACAEAPATTGSSYQCRNSRDCGPNLKCVAGANGILGQCVVDVGPGLTVLCTSDDVAASCGMGGICARDAGNGLLGCTDAGVDAGVQIIDAGPPIVWAQDAFVKASNPDVNDDFGEPVVLSADGNVMVVGAWQESSGARGINGNQLDNGVRNSGAVYIYRRSGTTWAQEAYLKPFDTNILFRFGYALAISADGTRLAVGAHKEEGPGAGVNPPQIGLQYPAAGMVYVYQYSAGAWALTDYLKASNVGNGDNFGLRIALSGDGDTLAVCAVNEASDATGINGDQTNNRAAGSGAVYVFHNAAAVWTQQAYLKASNSEAGDSFGLGGGREGVALSFDGNTLAVGAPGEDSAATGINGNQADNSAMNSGAAYVFRRTGNAWAQEAYVKASNTEAGDVFGGLALSADGETLVVTAHGEDSSATGSDGDQSDNSALSSGAGYVFKRTGSAWSQTAYLKAATVGPQDNFGFGVAMSSDGRIIAIGAHNEASNATGSNGDATNRSIPGSGAVDVFRRVGEAWVQRSYVKASNPGMNEYFGISVALSADATTMAVGANYEASASSGINPAPAAKTAPQTGAVYVFTH